MRESVGDAYLYSPRGVCVREEGGCAFCSGFVHPWGVCLFAKVLAC